MVIYIYCISDTRYMNKSYNGRLLAPWSGLTMYTVPEFMCTAMSKGNRRGAFLTCLQCNHRSNCGWLNKNFKLYVNSYREFWLKSIQAHLIIKKLWNLAVNLHPLYIVSRLQRFEKDIINTICPRSSYPIYTVTYYIKWVTTSWTHGILGLNFKLSWRWENNLTKYISR